MSQQELLIRVAAILDREGIPYMLTGSWASSFQGEPRMSHDIDLVVTLAESQIPKLKAAFPEPDFYLSTDAMREAIQHRSMFNLLSIADGDKVDFWLLTDKPFDQSRFSRRRTETIDGAKIAMSSPEDTILMKLRWSLDSGGSEKQFVDALRIFEVRHHALDFEYLERWIEPLGISELWAKLKNVAEAQ